MLVSSLFFWSFLGTSFLVCTALLQNYWDYPQLTVRTVLGSSLLVSLGFATMMTFIARRYTFSRMLERMTAAPVSLSGIATGFGTLSDKMGVSGVSLREALSGSAFSISLSGQGVVAMPGRLTLTLCCNETDTGLVHV